MATLSSSSTLAQVEAEYDNTASYFEDESVALAKRHATAIRILLRRYPSSMAKGGNTLSNRDLSAQLAAVQDFILARDVDQRAGPSVTRADFRAFR